MTTDLIPSKDMTVAGIPDYVSGGLHFDVVGSWGGHRAVVARFIPKGEADLARQELFMYILVGHFWEVGRMEDRPGVSIWDVAKLITEAMQNGVDPNLMYERVKDICEPSFS